MKKTKFKSNDLDQVRALRSLAFYLQHQNT